MSDTNMSDTSLKLPSPAAPARPLTGYWVMLLVCMLVFGAIAVGVANVRHQLKSEIKELEHKLTDLGRDQGQRYDDVTEDLEKARLRLENNLNSHQSRLSDIDQRLEEHQKRLQSLTSHSLDERVLTEALLLLKQSNQRLLLEKDVTGATTLLAEVEKMLASITGLSANTEFLTLRQAINRDLTALKLLTPIDKEGLFLQLNSLIDLAPQLSQKPKFEIKDDALEPVVTTSWRDWVSEAWLRAKHGLSNYVRLESRSEKIKPLLSDESTQIIELTLRLVLEQAQVALLQGRQAVYTTSLSKAESLLQQYYWESASLSQYRATLQQLRGANLSQELPSLSESIGLLQGLTEPAAAPAPAEAPTL
jgi:uroporphyrin-III C-methyltransferase